MSHKPAHRRLQIFSLDPSADVEVDSALISRSVLKIPWEDLTPSPSSSHDVGPGPVGEYIEVMDVDPASDYFYEPIDLDQPHLLATDGLTPSTGNPQFHQQMVYAVAMKTITNFEQALGRKVQWSERSRDYTREEQEQREGHQAIKRYLPMEERFVRRLRIYPHALREENAFYSPRKKSLLFGYFNAPTTDPREELPGSIVFTCLSHDIIAHETTHAILDGIHRRLLDASNPDMIAFHEAFSDIVAIFQHFTLPGLLIDQIQRTRGDLASDNLLAKLAIQFARSTGRGAALRNALGMIDEAEGRQLPDPQAFNQTYEPHERGAILVAAVFDAFIKIYENRVADLYRIATGGTGVLPDGEIHPDLANRLAEEAQTAADRVLTMCIRAVDYLPPVDITFGDYLRALLTADSDLTPDDPARHRLAFIQAFRDHGIYPLDVRTLAEDSLQWVRVQKGSKDWDGIHAIMPPPNLLRTMTYAYNNQDGDYWLRDVFERKARFWHSKNEEELESAALELLEHAWGHLGKVQTSSNINNFRSESSDERKNRFLLEKAFSIVLQHWISQKAQKVYNQVKDDPDLLAETCYLTGRQLGLDLAALASNDRERHRPVEIHAVRPTMRLRPDGHSKVELLIVLTQKRFEEILDDNGEPLRDSNGEPLAFKYRGGSNLIVDPEQGIIEYSIVKNLMSETRKKRHVAFFRNQIAEYGDTAITHFGLTEQGSKSRRNMEPLAMVHQGHSSKGGYFHG